MNRNSGNIDMTEAGSDVLFIVGPGRSGTTLLYKGLCLHPEIAWISNYLARFPGSRFWPMLNRIGSRFPGVRQRAWFGKRSNAYFNERNPLLKMMPTPVEGESVYSRCDIPLFPRPEWEMSGRQIECLRQAFDNIRKAQGGRLFMSKRTANNRRIAQLLRAFPRAKFLYIIRDGRATATSMMRAPWWRDHQVWWLDGKTPRQWESEGGHPLELAARNWVEEVDEIERGLQSVPDEQVMQIRYEELIEKSSTVWSAVESFLDVPRSREWLEEVSSLMLTDQNRGWRDTLSPDEKRILERVQSDMLARLGYLDET